MTVFEEAICFAVQAHQGMTRKGAATPYIVHPLEVAVICAEMTNDPEVLAAAVLHDTVEDTQTSLQELEERFGKRVAALVWSETENKYVEQPPADTWRKRKEESLKRLQQTEDPAVKLLWLSDKLANIRSFYRAWKNRGDAIWEEFNQKDPAQQAWYYRSVLTELEDLKGCKNWQELHDIVQEIFAEVECNAVQA